VLPGEELRCNGCHSPASDLSHGRTESFASVYAGATATGVPFPNTDLALFTDFGETMAETRSRISCVTDCAVLNPSVDVVYDDVWTDEAAAGRPADPSFSYSYLDLDTPPPTSLECLTTWSSRCRIVINYEQHIHPLWSLPRQLLDPDDPMIVLQDNTCTTAGCHTTLDAMNNTQVPQAQLDLQDGPSPDEAAHFNAYRELLFTDNEQQLVGAALQDIVIDIGPDADGNPILVNVPVAPSMSVAGANASGAFFSRFDAGGIHEGWLTPVELRLIAEWLDIGGQYFNDPFDPAVPLN
jgi:hypothetical protein